MRVLRQPIAEAEIQTLGRDLADTMASTNCRFVSVRLDIRSDLKLSFHLVMES